ncbi:MAG TPA: ribonuclease H-like domain-containing protein [Bellilinea sp.]|nr:ribonuclease H-like domain-containing protein [Bellilinea sp.]
MEKFTGLELLRIWEAAKAASGTSQRELARLLGLPFDSMHGKLFRAQKSLSVERESTLFIEYPKVELRSAVFDIECMSLTAGGMRDHLVCVSILPLDSDQVQTLKLEFSDHRDDRRLLKEVREALEEYDILIGHNIIAFDFNWLNTRLTYHNMEPFEKRFLYYDTYQAARRMALKADRKSLGFLTDFFRIDGTKTSVLPVSWSMIDSPNETEFQEALGDIVYHCEMDVRANRSLFDALWPRDKSLANLPITKKW